MVLKIATYTMAVASIGLQIGALATTKWLISDPYETNLFSVYSKNPDPKKDSKVSDDIIKKLEDKDKSSYTPISGLAMGSIVLILLGIGLFRLGFNMIAGGVFTLSMLCAISVIALLTSLRYKIFGEDSTVKLGYSWYMYLGSAVSLLITALLIFNVEPEEVSTGMELSTPPLTPRAPAYQAPAIQSSAYQAPAIQSPAYQAAAYQAPAIQSSAYQAPAYQAPAYYYQQRGYY